MSAATPRKYKSVASAGGVPSNSNKMSVLTNNNKTTKTSKKNSKPSSVNNMKNLKMSAPMSKSKNKL